MKHLPDNGPHFPKDLLALSGEIGGHLQFQAASLVREVATGAEMASVGLAITLGAVHGDFAVEGVSEDSGRSLYKYGIDNFFVLDGEERVSHGRGVSKKFSKSDGVCVCPAFYSHCLKQI